MLLRLLVMGLVSLGAWSQAAAQPSGSGSVDPSAPSEEAVWYYAAQGKTVGPHGLSEIRAMCADGTIRRDTQVYHPDFDWRLARDVPELKDAFAVGPPPPPPPPSPPPPAQNYDQQAADYLVGGWDYQYEQMINGMNMTVRFELSFRAGTGAGGDLSGVEHVTVPPMAGSPSPVTGSQPLSGTWSVRAYDATSFTLTVQYNANPAFSDSFTILDRNTLRSSQGNRMHRR